MATSMKDRVDTDETKARLEPGMNMAYSNDSSRAATPNAAWFTEKKDTTDVDMERLGRSRPRVFPYAKYLPYQTETSAKREQDLNEMMKHLYISVSAGDFVPGAVHWTKEIRGWMSLKFDLSRTQRIVLVNLYYQLSLAPGLDYSVAERFASMFMVLTKRKHYLRPIKDLTLDWRPLYKELKIFVLPCDFATQNTYSSKRSVRTLTKLCTFGQLFFAPTEIPALLEELLPYFSMSFSEHAFVVIGLLNLLMPTSIPPADRPDLFPQNYLPTLFHLWSILSRSIAADQKFIDLFSRLARDCMGAEHLPWSAYGLFTETQSELVFTSILRLLEIPVGQSSSPYSSSVDIGSGLSVLLDRDQRKHPVAHNIARWIIMSLSPACLEANSNKSVLHQLEALIQGIETFFHPSNSGQWTKGLAQLVYFFADIFVMRWNREHNGEYEVPVARRLTPAIKRRFVLCLREVVFMGIYSKSSTAMNYSLSALQSLAFLEPSLILPGALQRIYPAMQGLVEPHRTVSSIRALQMLSRVMARTKGYRCHLTTLLGLTLPGIDANDLDKTMNSLAFIQSVCYNIPICDLTQEKRPKSVEDPDADTDADVMNFGHGTATAVQWITEQMERFEREGAMISLDYDAELSDENEERILKSSTAGFAEFLISFMGRVFTLLQNLPDASRVKTGSPEENIVNTLPATFSPLLAALSPDLFDIALQQVSKFISNHVVHQARDAMAFICNALVKVEPKKALAHLLPGLLSSIRTEINENGAGSTRTTGSEILPRDRALVWNISLLSMCVVHVGADVLFFQEELFDIANFMQEKCKGIPLVHVSNFIHHLLLNLTVTYTTDYSLYEEEDVKNGIGPAQWGSLPDAKSLNIKWHLPSNDEIAFAVRLYNSQASHAIQALDNLMGENSPVRRDGTGKDWSDEVSRYLVLLRLIISGVSCLFRSDDPSISPYILTNGDIPANMDIDMESDVSNEAILSEPDDEKIRKSFQYPTGYPLKEGSGYFKTVHDIRKATGEILHRVHSFLTLHQEDDVTCFNSLYTAYKTWFIDIGIERSAHVLDRLTRLFAADIHPFKFSGTRKSYPRPLLIRRANLYHFQRLRHNEAPRLASELDKTLLLDLAESSVSIYTDIRRTAQSASEAAMKCILGAKPLIIPPLLDTMEKAVLEADIPRIKGAIFSLLFGSLARPIGRNWRVAPRMIRLFLRMSDYDRPSIQKLVASAAFQIADMCKASDRVVILDPDTINALWPTNVKSGPDTIAASIEEANATIPVKQNRLRRRRYAIESIKRDLGQELVETIKKSHWKKASRTAVLVIGLDYRFETVASDGMLDLVVNGVIDPHPSLRSLYASAMVAIFALIQTRALVDHKYENYIIDRQFPPDLMQIETKPEEVDWTTQHLQSFARPEANLYYDLDYPGWLVWDKTMSVYNPRPEPLKFDQVEQGVRRKIGSLLSKEWFKTYFDYMKQEPRDSHADRFRMTSSMIVAYCMELVFGGLTSATFDDIKGLVLEVYGDGTDKHQHRATAEIMGALLTTTEDVSVETREEIWSFVFPIVVRIFQEGLTPENKDYWSTFVTLVLGGKDPRRCWPLVDWISSFKLDMSSNAAFKESVKISLLYLIINTLGWHWQLDKEVLQNFLEHLDHPYKGVREIMGITLATIFRTRYHESYKDVQSLLEAQRNHASDGTQPYEPSPEFCQMMKSIFEQLEVWRKERPAGTQTPTSYTQASKTVLLWLDTTLSSNDCRSLVPFFPDIFMEQLLHMMDVKEDPELQNLAYHVFRQLPSIPHMPGSEDSAFINSMIRIGRTSTLWHQRLRILINIQVIYFRHLFFMSTDQAQNMVDCVRDMLHDVQVEVRMGAAATISGMIRCSPEEFRNKTVVALQEHFTRLLEDNPLPKRAKHAPSNSLTRLKEESGSRSSSPGSTRPATPTPEQNKIILNRHAAVLGLGALVQAFPYASPPPAWLPEVLATLAGKAAGEGGMVGKSVKSVLSEFKKTRQDTWHVDVKVSLFILSDQL